MVVTKEQGKEKKNCNTSLGWVPPIITQYTLSLSFWRPTLDIIASYILDIHHILDILHIFVSWKSCYGLVHIRLESFSGYLLVIILIINNNWLSSSFSSSSSPQSSSSSHRVITQFSREGGGGSARRPEQSADRANTVPLLVHQSHSH